MEVSNLLVQSFLNSIDQHIIIILVLVTFVLIKFFLKLRMTVSDLGYRSKETLFSNAEKSFFFVLNQALSDSFEIFGKVRIADVLTPNKGLSRKQWSIAFSSISSKHFDFVLCDKKTLAIVAVLELDDKSHNQSKVIKRDAFVEKACQSANVKLVRFQCRSSYELQYVRDTVINSLKP